jgi:uncharacterized protein YbjT (DUF2867 family)
MASQQLVILGGTGFVGSRLIPRLAADGHRIVVLSRNREQHRDLGVLPGVSIRSADVYDDEALRQQLAGADAVINLIGILNSQGQHTFQRAHVEVARRLIAACEASGVNRLHQMSSLKAGQGLSNYLKTRGEAETLVKASPLDWTIYQPSVIFGRGDGLVTRFSSLLRKMRLAPTWVGDVAEAIARCVNGHPLSHRHSFELFGAEVLTLGQIVRSIRDNAGLRTPIMALPDSLGRLQAQVAELLPGKPFSMDNFRSLRTDSVGKVDGYAALGIVQQPFTPWLQQLLHEPARQRRLNQARSQRR